MPKIAKLRKPVSAEQIARMADRGENISRFFTRKGKMMPPIRRVNVDFAEPMLQELDCEAQALNISRQAVIKSLLRQALDQQRLARTRLVGQFQTALKDHELTRAVKAAK
jgi:hypothetical protein